MTKKVRAVRLPLEERVLESMGKDLEKNGLVSQQSHQITISAVENWIKYNVEPAFPIVILHRFYDVCLLRIYNLFSTNFTE